MPGERTRLEQDLWSISVIVMWEIATLSQLGRIELDLEDRALKRALRQIKVRPLDLAICRATLDLDFDSDPADEIIAATSLVLDLPLITRDRKLRASRLIKTP